MWSCSQGQPPTPPPDKFSLGSKGLMNSNHVPSILAFKMTLKMTFRMTFKKSFRMTLKTWSFDGENMGDFDWDYILSPKY